MERSLVPVEPPSVAEPGDAGTQDEVAETGKQVVGRFGSFLLTAPEFAKPYRAVYEALAAALEEDPRVAQVQVDPEYDDQWSHVYRMYPRPKSAEAIDTGSDSLDVMCFASPIRFSADIPEKNQRRVLEQDRIPTHYEVLWDGSMCLVTWTIGHDEVIPMSGGHVIADILGDAARRSGFTFFIQACSPGCKHGFAHTSLRFVAKEGGRIEYDATAVPSEVGVRIRSTADPAERFFWNQRTTHQAFTELKNQGRRLLDIEKAARLSLERAMVINYSRASLTREAPWRALRDRWATRRWARDLRFEISRVWLLVTQMEALRREWAQERFRFDAATEEAGSALLYTADYADEVDRVESLDPELMRSAVGEAAERLDSQALLRVTLVAALAGGGAGAVLGAIVGHI